MTEKQLKDKLDKVLQEYKLLLIHGYGYSSKHADSLIINEACKYLNYDRFKKIT